MKGKVTFDDVTEIDLDGYVDEAKGVRYVGKVGKQADGMWRCLAIVNEHYLCIVEVRIRPEAA